MRFILTTAVSIVVSGWVVVFSLVAQDVSEEAAVALSSIELIDPELVPRPTLLAIRTSGPIIIDGVLNEVMWAGVEPAQNFIQATPNTGAPATERTEVRILYDDEALYIGAMLYDREPDKIIAQQMAQDFYSPNEDILGISIDTFLDHRNAYYLMINANGAVRDGQAYDNSRASNVEWEGIMSIEASIHHEGWSVEISIPFKTLRFDPSRPVQEWGLNLLRRIRRKNEDSYWAPLARRTRVHRMDQAGKLIGLPKLSASRNVTIKPYVLGENLGGSLTDVDLRGSGSDGGIDIKWGVTPGLTADLTWRTDFAQVDADQEQVNLTRFPVFFPEKREFFIENSGTYQFGDISERNYRLGASPRDFTLFHSRRIGLSSGRPISIVAGGRLTGRTAGFEVGVLNMQTKGTNIGDTENFTVARVRRTILDAIDVGGIFVNRQGTALSSSDATGDDGVSYNRSWGIDANARLLGNLVLHSYLAETYEPGVSRNNRAARISAAWRDTMWNTSILYRLIGSQFNPEVGFVRRRGVSHYYGTLGAHPRTGLPTINEVNPYLEFERYTGPSGIIETQNLVAVLAISFLDGGALTIHRSNRYERLGKDFSLLDGLIPSGVYDFSEASIAYVSSAARKLSGELRMSGGGYFQGKRRSIGGSVVWRPNAHFGLDLGFDHNILDLQEVPLTVEVLSGRIDYALSTKWLTGAWVQYNNATEEVITNIRMNFIHSPLSDFFAVFSERRSNRGQVVLDRRFTVKVTKLLAF
jgi:hypothetical protein